MSLVKKMLVKPYSRINNEEKNQKRTIGRRLVDSTTLWQDWGDENPEAAAKYWELFTDLLLVAAASALADNLMEHGNLVEYFLLYSVMINSWLLYTHHYTSRFQENSLAHSAVLFVYVSGMALSIVNVGMTSRFFILAVMIQRFAYFCMIVPVMQMERSHEFGVLIGVWVLLSLVCLIPAGFKPEEWCFYMLIAVAIIDYTSETGMVYILKGNLLVPINIEHTKDRLGVLVLVMLGETVISASIANREMGEEQQFQYYIVLMLSFLLIFLLCLTYFNVQPPPEFHAFRRSRTMGYAMMVTHRFLGFTLLTVGVSIKLAIAAMVGKSNEELEEESEEKINPAYASRLLALSVGASMVILLIIRVCHYGGILPKPTHPKPIYRLFMIWWYTFISFAFLPFLFVWVSSIVQGLCIQCGLLLVLTIVETYYTHELEDELPNEESVRHLDESSNLLAEK